MRSIIVTVIVAMLGILPMAGCGSSSGGYTGDPLAKNPGNGSSTPAPSTASYTVTVTPAKLAALTNEEQIITATVKDSSGKPVANSDVYFTIAAGPASVITSRMATDSNGVALAFIRTGTTSATTNVIIEAATKLGAGNVTGYGNFQVSPGDANQIGTKLSLAVTSFAVKPNEQVVVTTTAKDASGNALTNQQVNLRIAAGPATMLTATATTDSNGSAVALVQAGNPATLSNVIVEARTTVNNNEVTAVIPFQVVPQGKTTQSYTMTMTASKSPVDNNEEFYVTAMLQDSGGNPVITQPVTFNIATGPATVNTPKVGTDSTGKSIATIRAGNPAFTSAVIIEASAVVNGTLVTALAPVQIMTKIFSESVLIMDLVSDKPTTGINSDVLLKATITDMQSQPKPVQNQPVKFSVVAGPATITDATMDTDARGTAVSRLRIGTVNSSSNVVVKASAKVNDVEVSAYTTIQIVRQNSYIINFLTSKAPDDPDGNLNTLKYEIKEPSYQGYVEFKQLVPFQVLDNNGIPKPNLDVTIEVYNYGRNPDTVVMLIPPYPGAPVTFPPDRTKVTVRTDDHGMGLFACNIGMKAPGPGLSNTESIIYSAAATISPENISLLSYGGFLAVVTQVPAPKQ
jgi:hypothetical protein